MDNYFQEQTEEFPQSKKNNYIPCKYPLCMICASPIIHQLQEDPLDSQCDIINFNVGNTSKATFLQAIGILCRTLNLEDNRFGDDDEWTKVLGSSKDFVRFVSCGKCGELLRKLVELRELILKTEQRLKETVDELESTVINSEGHEHAEYSINMCLRFREEVVKGFQKRNATRPLKVSHPNKARPLSVKRRLQKEEALSRTPQVKLEKLLISENNLDRLQESSILSEPATSFQLLNESEDESYFPSNDAFTNDDDDDEDEEFCPKVKRKRGRPPKRNSTDVIQKGRRKTKQTAVKKLKRRGRPSKNKAKLNSETEKGKDAVSISVENDEDLDFHDNEDEYHPSRPSSPEPEDSDDDPQSDPEPTFKKAVKRKRDQNLNPLDPSLDGRVRRLDDPFNDRRKCTKVEKLLGDDGHYYLRPFLVIDENSGILSYYNCKIHLEQDRLLCRHPDCNYEHKFDYFTISQFYAFRAMRLHVQTHRRSVKPEELDESAKGFHICPYCDLKFERRFFFIQHVKAEHISSQPFPCICEVCGMILPHKDLLDHVMTHKNSEEIKIAHEKPARGKQKDPFLPKDFPCDKCHLRFEEYTKYRIHSQCHVPLELRQQFQCEICAERLCTQGGLNAHMRSVHLQDDNPYPFQCNICSRKFTRREKRTYLSHLRSHTGERPFQCMQCGKRFVSKKSLEHHENLHKDRQIQCEYCTNVYRNVKYLKNHHRKHHPEIYTVKPKVRKPNAELQRDAYGPKLMYPCEPCGKVYTFKSQLIPHLRHAHKMFLEKNSDYPNMITLEDHLQIKNSRNRAKKSGDSSGSQDSQKSEGVGAVLEFGGLGGYFSYS